MARKKTFAQWVEELGDKDILYDCRYDGSYGDLMPLKVWLTMCENSALIDWDGYGDLYSATGEFISGCILPSQREQVAADPRAAFVLWYNK